MQSRQSMNSDDCSYNIMLTSD